MAPAAAQWYEMDMPLFLLTPQNLESEEWALSTHMCPVQVRADDAIQARYRAAAHFDTGRRAAGLTRPWLKVDLASVRAIDDVDAQMPYIEGHTRARAFRRGFHRAAAEAAAVTQAEPQDAETIPRWAQRPR